MGKRVNTAMAVVLILMLFVGHGAVVANTERNAATNQEEFAKKAKRKFKGSVKASIKTKGKLRYGDEVTLRATVKDAKKAEYTLQWQIRESKKDEWVDIIGETGKEYTFVITEENAKCEWRVALIAEAFEE